MSAAGRREPARLMFAIPKLDDGGPDRVMFELLQSLPRNRFAPSLAVIEAGGRYWERLPDDVETIVTGGGRYPIRPVARAIDRHRPDLLFATLRMIAAAGMASFIARHRPALVFRQANQMSADFALLKRQSLVKHRLAERIARLALRRADAVVAQSRDMADDLRPMLRRGQRLETIGNPIDLAAIEALAAEPAAPLPGRPALLAVGRLMPQKGFDLLVEAMPEVVATHPQAELTIIGQGPDEAMLRARIAALGLERRVHLAGRHPNPPALMARADLLVSSSRYEGFPNVVLEAMAAGCPVAATDCPGATSELIADGRTGWLAPEISGASIAAAITRALDRGPQSTVAAAKALLARDFSRTAIARRYTKLFDEVIRART